MPTTVLDRPAAPVDDLTRRELIASGLAAAVLSACRDRTGSSRDQRSEEIGDTTRSIAHDFATTDLRLDLERIAVLDACSVDHLLAVGVTPIAVQFEPPSYLAGMLDGIDVLSDAGGDLRIEALVAARPDLVIAWRPFVDDVLSEIQQVAPTIGVVQDSFADWAAPLRFVADVVDRQRKAEELISVYERRVAEITGALASAGMTGHEVSVVRSASDILCLAAGNGSFSTPILDTVGLVRSGPQRQESDFGEIDLSLEAVDQADADIIFVLRRPEGDTEADALLDDALAGPLWPTLRAVQFGRVYDVALSPWLEGGAIAANLVLDGIERLARRAP